MILELHVADVIDDHKAYQALLHGRLGFPAQAVTKPWRGRGNLSRAKCTSSMQEYKR